MVFSDMSLPITAFNVFPSGNHCCGHHSRQLQHPSTTDLRIHQRTETGIVIVVFKNGQKPNKRWKLCNHNRINNDGDVSTTVGTHWLAVAVAQSCSSLHLVAWDQMHNCWEYRWVFLQSATYTTTRKHRQSYWYADPCRQQQQTAVAAHVTSNCTTAMVFVTVSPWLLTFWPLGQCMPSNYYRVYVPSLMLIAQAVFLLECGQTDRRDGMPYPCRRLFSWHR